MCNTILSLQSYRYLWNNQNRLQITFNFNQKETARRMFTDNLKDTVYVKIFLERKAM